MFLVWIFTSIHAAQNKKEKMAYEKTNRKCPFCRIGTLEEDSSVGPTPNYINVRCTTCGACDCIGLFQLGQDLSEKQKRLLEEGRRYWCKVSQDRPVEIERMYARGIIREGQKKFILLADVKGKLLPIRTSKGDEFIIYESLLEASLTANILKSVDFTLSENKGCVYYDDQKIPL